MAFYVNSRKAKNVMPTLQAFGDDDELTIEEERRLHVQEAESLKGAGEVCAQQEDYKGALGCWSKAVMLDPQNYTLHELRAQVLNELGRCWEAVEAATRATKLNPAWPEGFLTLSRAQLNIGEPTLALKSIQVVLELQPDHPEATEELENIQRLSAVQASTATGTRLAMGDHAISQEQHALTESTGTHALPLVRPRGEPEPLITSSSSATAMSSMPAAKRRSVVGMRSGVPAPSVEQARDFFLSQICRIAESQRHDRQGASESASAGDRTGPDMQQAAALFREAFQSLGRNADAPSATPALLRESVPRTGRLGPTGVLGTALGSAPMSGLAASGHALVSGPLSTPSGSGTGEGTAQGLKLLRPMLKQPVLNLKGKLSQQTTVQRSGVHGSGAMQRRPQPIIDLPFEVEEEEESDSEEQGKAS